jgi:hypothetical protein
MINGRDLIKVESGIVFSGIDTVNPLAILNTGHT